MTEINCGYYKFNITSFFWFSNFSLEAEYSVRDSVVNDVEITKWRLFSEKQTSLPRKKLINIVLIILQITSFQVRLICNLRETYSDIWYQRTSLTHMLLYLNFQTYLTCIFCWSFDHKNIILWINGLRVHDVNNGQNE